MSKTRRPNGVATGEDHPEFVSPSDEHTYRSAGVDLDAAQLVKESIKRIVSTTHGPEVLGGVGGFGGLYELRDYRNPVLVSSTDGVGTKLKIAAMMARYDTIGEDLVNLCLNDVIVVGARPLFFLDYIAVGELQTEMVFGLVSGMARACRQSGCALIGGDTAQMGSVYAGDEFDLAGFVVGVVEKDEILDPSSVAEGDRLIGLPSSGLHTNGYSLVRHVLGLDEDPSQLRDHHDELDGVLGDVLLTPHRPYFESIKDVLPLVKSMAHITGGGLIENMPRALPADLGAEFDADTWPVPPVFPFLQERSSIERDEMYRVFNMGLGLVLVCGPSEAAEILRQVPSARDVGRVTKVDDEGTRVIV